MDSLYDEAGDDFVERSFLEVNRTLEPANKPESGRFNDRVVRATDRSLRAKRREAALLLAQKWVSRGKYASATSRVVGVAYRMLIDKPALYLEELRHATALETERVCQEEDERRRKYASAGPSRLRECVSAEDLEEEEQEDGVISWVLGFIWN